MEDGQYAPLDRTLLLLIAEFNGTVVSIDAPLQNKRPRDEDHIPSLGEPTRGDAKKSKKRKMKGRSRAGALQEVMNLPVDVFLEVR